MRDAIVELLPEINWIKDSKLREAVIECHVEALTEGGWEPVDMDRIPFALTFPNCPTSYLRHIRAVTRMCRTILEEYNEIYKGQGDFKLDHDTLIAGAILHDIGKFLEWTRFPDGSYGISEAGELLRHPLSGIVIAMRHGISAEIANVIVYHAREGEGEKRTPESVIVARVDLMNADSIKSHLGHLQTTL
jgi:putative nucleotidyltransferase with HDIG domain